MISPFPGLFELGWEDELDGLALDSVSACGDEVVVSEADAEELLLWWIPESCRCPFLSTPMSTRVDIDSEVEEESDWGCDADGLGFSPV